MSEEQKRRETRGERCKAKSREIEIKEIRDGEQEAKGEKK
jgi:hypothetical protein